ncbi:MAG: glycosyltransferase family 2 protein, partial [Alphaproteobacteria bacterium]
MLTVLMATRDGAAWLERSLQSHCRLKPPAGGYKLVIVDNGSGDATVDIIQSFRDRLPLTMLHEPRAGKNRALNRGLRCVEGELVVFTGDDVVVPPDWLVQFQRLAAQYPEIAIFGGPVLPLWPQSPPSAILDAVPHGPAFA